MKNKGFSLVELVVILAIIGTLAAIAVPNFGEMQRKETRKSDLNKVTLLLRESQHRAQVEKRYGMLVFGDSKLVANLYTETSNVEVPVVKLASVGRPAAPVPENPAPSNPGITMEPPVRVIEAQTSLPTLGYTTIFVDRFGLFYFTDPDTNKHTYGQIALCFRDTERSSIVINGNQIRTGKLPEGKACEPKEVVL